MRSPRYIAVRPARTAAFTLVELLTVVAIMAITLGLLVVGLGQGQSRGVQMGAAQVASGLGVARQTAITRNTDALFIVATRGRTSEADFFPAEPYRYWAVVSSNRGADTWSLVTDWTELPSGSVFMGLTGEGYNSINWSTDGEIPPPGTAFRPRIAPSRNGDWQVFNSFTNTMRIEWPGGATLVEMMPFIGFKPTGKGFAPRTSGGTGGPPRHAAVVLADGAARGSGGEGEIILRSTNNITHVEIDAAGGRIVVRPRDSYR
jgi:type II secretory pathway pseudopilin PulG